jgi:hypothetical protein
MQGGARPPKYYFGFGRVDPVFGLVPVNPPPAPPLAREVQRQQEEKRRQLLVQQQEQSQHAHRMRELEHQAELRRAANRQDATDIARWQREQRAGTSKRLLAEMVGAPGDPAADGGGGGAAKRSRLAALKDKLAQLEQETRAAARRREAQEELKAREAQRRTDERLKEMLAEAKNMEYQKELDKLLTEEQRKKKEAAEAREACRRAAAAAAAAQAAEAKRQADAAAQAAEVKRQADAAAAAQAAEAKRQADAAAAASLAQDALPPVAVPPVAVPPAAHTPGGLPEYLGSVRQQVEASKDDVARKDLYTGRAAAPAQKAVGVKIVKAAQDFARIGTIPGGPQQRVPQNENLGTVNYARIAMGNIPPWLGTLDAETQKFALERILHKVVLPVNEVDEEQYMERPICITHGAVVVNLERTLTGQGVKQQALRKLNVFCIATDPKHLVPPHQYWQLWQIEAWPRLETLPSVGHAYGHTVPRGPPGCGIWAKEKKPRGEGPDPGKDYQEWKYHIYARVGVMAAILTYPNDEAQWQRPTDLFDAAAAWAWVAAVVNNLRELQTKSEQGGVETMEVAYDYDFWMGALRVFLKVGGYYMHCKFAGQFDKVLRLVERLLTRKVRQYHGRVSPQTPLNDALGVYKQHLTSLDGNHFPVKISAVHVAEFILEQRSLHWPLPGMVRKFFTGRD